MRYILTNFKNFIKFSFRFSTVRAMKKVTITEEEGWENRGGWESS